MKRTMWIITLVILATVLAGALAQAATYYVAQDGSGDFTTITAAYNQALPGDTVIVKPGVYTEYQSGYGLHLTRSGTAASPIILKSQVKWQAILDGGNKSGRDKPN